MADPPRIVVSMGLPQRAIDDADYVERVYGFPNKATAVGAALALARVIAEHGSRGRLRLHRDGEVYEVELPWRPTS